MLLAPCPALLCSECTPADNTDGSAWLAPHHIQHDWCPMVIAPRLAWCCSKSASTIRCLCSRMLTSSFGRHAMLRLPHDSREGPYPASCRQGPLKCPHDGWQGSAQALAIKVHNLRHPGAFKFPLDWHARKAHTRLLESTALARQPNPSNTHPYTHKVLPLLTLGRSSGSAQRGTGLRSRYMPSSLARLA